MLIDWTTEYTRWVNGAVVNFAGLLKEIDQYLGDTDHLVCYTTKHTVYTIMEEHNLIFDKLPTCFMGIPITIVPIEEFLQENELLFASTSHSTGDKCIIYDMRGM